jgi:hypothetical protein
MKCHTLFSFHLIQFSLALSKPLNKLQVNKEIPQNKLQVNIEEIPPQFESATNQLQICNWLVAHPNILKLANDMLAASSASTSSTSTSSSSPSLVSDNVSTRFDYFDIFWNDFFYRYLFYFFCILLF